MKKSELYKYVSDYEIFREYLGKDFALGDVMSSPFRKDDNPSFNIFRHYDGELIFKDFVIGSGDAIKFVSVLKDIKRSEALSLIAEDFDIEHIEKIPYRPILKESKRTLINIKTRPFTVEEAAYWYALGINGDLLQKYDVQSLESFTINSSKPFKSKGFCFAYIFDEGTKIYKPFDTKYKWITNCSGGLQGYKQLPLVGHNLIITKSLKDVITLRAHGVCAVAPHGEGNSIEDSHIEELKKRFQNIYVLYDIDKAGYLNSNHICKKHNLKQIFINNNYCIYKDKNGIKDISDFRKKHGERETKLLINRWLSV